MLHKYENGWKRIVLIIPLEWMVLFINYFGENEMVVVTIDGKYNWISLKIEK